ncbi:DsbA family protein [Micromonospora sp. HM5-17]|jgi:predicted DsbA family dithiol-disulfide isomerase|uniref:DsbA family oxidoreductase n=1 Tax=Micromonospora sp. HM5-17 TaxID=2487710 RepID=UPI000F4ABD93|nr:DsbA family oxidoreductase [Micromonospora sp. HM5-17]ROT29421.1 DsbA family oxidoreductase [Micromonospora sp. HM5-17]
MVIEVFSDLVCPWCYIGKRRLDLALARVERPVEVRWRAFQLDPDYPTDVRWTLPEAHLNRYGLSRAENDRRLAMVTAAAAEVGLRYDLNRAVMANTRDAHRLVHHGRAHGKDAQVAELLMRAYATEGRWIGDPTTLNEIAAEAGLPPMPPGAYEAEVEADLARARRLGVRGVPSVVVNGAYPLVAPDVEQLVRALGSDTPDPERRRVP